ncbi:class I SAM-dependent methyltransferase [Thioalkalivibrio sp. ALE9]|uniref:class I SAM-dependent methyltransferase n=1 Tax=Thioalkalivibrio sp. ALE9 TaxID=1158169 RepID=UPI00037B8CC8|nr:methyltransferase domain-containing protein [Thioalkalivibrio sp. ALE9]
MNRDNARVWQRHAAQWNAVGAPLKPSPEDLQILGQEIGHAEAAFGETPWCLLLGVTPELAQHQWPKASRLVAVDQSAEMIGTVWAENPSIWSRPLRGRWEQLPLPSRKFAVIAGDGALNVLATAEQTRLVAGELARLLSPQGRLLLRCFVRPDVPESTAAVCAEAMDGRIKGFHAFKWRLAMSLIDPSHTTVVVEDIWKAFERHIPNREDLARRSAWDRCEIDTIDAYRGNHARYTFPTLTELRSTLNDVLHVESVRWGTYELAERCPNIALSRREP